MLKRETTIAYIHGYNTSFREALVGGAKIAEKWAVNGATNVIVFSWPSDGKLTPFVAYRNDRDDAKASGGALSRLMLKFRDFLNDIERGDECNAHVHLVAHSMGNYVLRHGVQAYKKRAMASNLQPLFTHSFLMAADEDHDAFEHEHKLAQLPELCGNVHCYFNRGDAALVVSDKTKQNPTRLGNYGPDKPHVIPGNVDSIDGSAVLSGLVEHNYFTDSARIIRDVRDVLAGVASDQIPGRRYVPAQNRYVLG